jgi:copper homeostasis protein
VGEESVLRFEACVTDPAGVLAAIEAGADRVELCADLAAGGVTPSIGLVEWTVRVAAASTGRLGVHVLVRPRGGDFVYSAAEVEVMLRDIAAVKAAGTAGIVIGALTPDGAVDRDLSARLVAAARPASVTFHRAFDAAPDPLAAFEAVRALGVDRLLTSGGAATALDGAAVIAELVRRSAGQIAILPGGGVTATTAAEVLRRSGARELHFSGQKSGSPEQPLAARFAAIMAAVYPAR